MAAMTFGGGRADAPTPHIRVLVEEVMASDSARSTGGEAGPEEPHFGDPEAAAAILAHVREYIGEVDSVFHEFEGHGVSIDIHHVPPTDGRNVHTFVTTGMSDRPMPEGSGVRHAELVLSVPADWDMSEEALEAGEAAWPLELLRALGRLPHEHGVAFDFGLCTDDRALPFGADGDMGFSAALLAPPVTVPDAFWCLDAGNGKVIDFFGVVLLYPEELAFARFEGVVALARKLDTMSVTELAQPGRKQAV